jgi:hypothetical protein
MRRLLLILATLAALPLSAATRYALAIDEAGRIRSHLDATVLAEGKQQRIDLAPLFAFDVLLSDDGGASSIALATDQNTWFPGPKWLLGRPHIYAPLSRGPRSIKKVTVTPSEEPSVAMAGFPTHKYVVKVSFTIRESMYRSPVEEKFGATIEIWTTDAIDAALAVRGFDLTTGIAEVDALLVPALAKVSGFALKTVLSATRMFTGGQPETCLITATVSDVRTVAAPPHAFDRPPLLGAPGKN